VARIRSVEGTRVTPLAHGWRVASAPAGRIASPHDLADAELDWCDATLPCTAASALRAAGRWSLEHCVDFDADDWWWRHTFSIERAETSAAHVLRFEGIASLAEIWLNGQSILQTDDMFTEYEVDVGARLEPENELVVVCRSLGTALKARRPRPRWRTRVVEAQQLRWFRTTLFGRIPAWAPPVAPVGPWRPIVLERRATLSVLRADVRPRLDGDEGEVELNLELAAVDGHAPDRVAVHLAGRASDLACDVQPDGRVVASGRVRVGVVERWWPHTHGTPARHPMHLVASVGSRSFRIDLGSAAFRVIELDRSSDGFKLRVNGVEVFCRGACWTPVDAAALTGSEADYRRALEAVRDAGMNMVRVGGPFFYEADAFYDVCDELGVLVWQDFSFANMDYPGDDPGFVATVEREAAGFLERTQLAGCIGVLCGNGEVEQQAAMVGAPREIWRSSLFANTLPGQCGRLRPDVPYWPSTPTGGALPFLNDVGTAHYFGVGAYLRPLEDARRAGVRFATECLAFANVPDPRVVDGLMKEGGVPPQDPRWKRRTPRDGSAGWDFDDVRDHYLRALFGVDPLALRYADPSRYLALSRVVTGEVMAATFAEWRRSESACAGALVWFLRDLWQGAGWGVLDADARPKAAYHALRRVLQPVAVLFADEGLNGLDVHVINEGPLPLEADLEVVFLRGGETPVAIAKAPAILSARSATRLRGSALLDQFLDTTYAYRFGPPAHDAAIATLVDRATGAVRGRAFHFPRGLEFHQEAEVGLEAQATPLPDGRFKLSVRARRLARWVVLDVVGFSPDDNYFHVAPGGTHELLLLPEGPGSVPRGTAQPLNAFAATKIALVK
jgi:beta-mannosidase